MPNNKYVIGIYLLFEHKIRMEVFWSAITMIGDIRFWFLFLFFLGLYVKLKRPKLDRRTKCGLLTLLLTLIIISLSVQAVKMAVNAPRICTPCPAADCNPHCPTDDPYAFPSGHAALSFAMFSAAWLAFPRNNKQRIRWAWLFLLPILISVSRIALGVHTAEQVAAGAVLGIILAIFAWKMAEFSPKNRNI